jgi:hypothetical protein
MGCVLTLFGLVVFVGRVFVFVVPTGREGMTGAGVGVDVGAF